MLRLNRKNTQGRSNLYITRRVRGDKYANYTGYITQTCQANVARWQLIGGDI